MDTTTDSGCGHACGPTADPEFFDGFIALMKKHPQLAGKYHIACADHETDTMGIDFESTVALKRIEGNRIVTEFVPRETALDAKGSECCTWECPINKPCKCVSWWVR